MLRRRRWTQSIRTSAAGQPWSAAEALGQHSAALDRCEASGCWPSPRAKSTGGDRPRAAPETRARQDGAAAGRGRPRARPRVYGNGWRRLATEDLTEPATEIAPTTLTEAQREATPSLQKLPVDDQRRYCAAAHRRRQRGRSTRNICARPVGPY